jgi:hypothetical protein
VWEWHSGQGSRAGNGFIGSSNRALTFRPLRPMIQLRLSHALSARRSFVFEGLKHCAYSLFSLDSGATRSFVSWACVTSMAYAMMSFLVARLLVLHFLLLELFVTPMSSCLSLSSSPLSWWLTFLGLMQCWGWTSLIASILRSVGASDLCR